MFIKTDCSGYINTEYVRRIYIQREDKACHIIADMGFGVHVIINTYYDREAAEDRLRSIVDQIDEEK